MKNIIKRRFLIFFSGGILVIILPLFWPEVSLAITYDKNICNMTFQDSSGENYHADDWCTNCPDGPYDFCVGNKHYHFSCEKNILQACNCKPDTAWYEDCPGNCTNWNCTKGQGCLGGFCNLTPCNCGDWTNIGCGLGGCSSDKMYQTRNCVPSGCNLQSRCVSDSSCVQKTKTCAQLNGEWCAQGYFCDGTNLTSQVTDTNDKNSHQNQICCSIGKCRAPTNDSSQCKSFCQSRGYVGGKCQTFGAPENTCDSPFDAQFAFCSSQKMRKWYNNGLSGTGCVWPGACWCAQCEDDLTCGTPDIWGISVSLPVTAGQEISINWSAYKVYKFCLQLLKSEGVAAGDMICGITTNNYNLPTSPNLETGNYFIRICDDSGQACGSIIKNSGQFLISASTSACPTGQKKPHKECIVSGSQMQCVLLNTCGVDQCTTAADCTLASQTCEQKGGKCCPSGKYCSSGKITGAKDCEECCSSLANCVSSCVFRCEDSDALPGGSSQVWDVQGTCKEGSTCGGLTPKGTDSCSSDGKTLIEWYCDGTTCKSTTHDCSPGICSAGKCVSAVPPSTTCPSLDGLTAPGITISGFNWDTTGGQCNFMWNGKIIPGFPSMASHITIPYEWMVAAGFPSKLTAANPNQVRDVLDKWYQLSFINNRLRYRVKYGADHPNLGEILSILSSPTGGICAGSSICDLIKRLINEEPTKALDLKLVIHSYNELKLHRAMVECVLTGRCPPHTYGTWGYLLLGKCPPWKGTDTPLEQCYWPE